MNISHSIFKRVGGVFERSLKDFPIKATFLLSRLQGKDAFPVTINGTTVVLGFRSMLHFNTAKLESMGKIEKEILDCWLEQEANVVYDVGGYNGLYGLLYAKRNPKSNVTIFEPDAINYQQIKDNIRLNNLLNCKVEKIAISDNEGKILFSQGGRQKEKIVDSGGSPVQAFPLSHFPKADLIKIDVEGAEGKVLQGLTYAANIVLELHSSAFLAQYGYTAEKVMKRVEELNMSASLISDRVTEKHYLLRQKPLER